MYADHAEKRTSPLISGRQIQCRTIDELSVLRQRIAEYEASVPGSMPLRELCPHGSVERCEP